jgi:dTDP-glucose pyrophosphorylase
LKALILAAGKGTRLGALTKDCPKPLLDLGGRPIIENILIPLRDAGVREFVVVTGHLAQMVEDRLGDGATLGVKISFRRQREPKGTGEAVLLARELLAEEPFVLSWGDVIISPENCGGIIADFESDPCDALLGLNWMDDPCSGAAVHLGDGDVVEKIIEKPSPGQSTTHWNNAGLMVFDPIVHEFTAKLTLSARGEYELPEAVANMLRDGRRVRGHRLSGFWSDVGTPEDLARTREAWQGLKTTCRQSPQP